MTTNVLSVRPDIPIISQKVLENRLDAIPGYSVTVSDVPTRPDIRVSPNKQLLWLNQYLVRKRWYNYLKHIIPDYDLVIVMGEPSFPVVWLTEAFTIPTVVFIRSLGITGLLEHNPTESHVRNLRRGSWGARVQYPFVVSHVRAMRRACRGADVVVSNSQYIQRELKQGFGVDSTVIYPPIELDNYHVEYNPEGKIGMVGPRIKRKGGYTFYELAQRMPEEEFISCGLLNPSDLERKQRDQENWTHVGWVEDMREFYRECKLVVVPSERDEAFGRAAAEPMVSGIPVVASDLGGLREVLGGTGVLVPPGSDAEQWEFMIRVALKNNRPEAKKERVRRYSATNQFNRFMEVIQDVQG